MDTVLIVLITMNIVAFILYMIDYEICARGGSGVKPEVLTNLVTILGGSLGTLLAFILVDICTPKFKMSHIEKQLDNQKFQSRLYATMWLIIHSAIYLVFYGQKSVEAKQWISQFYQSHTIFCIYIIAINVITFIIFAADKIKAMLKKKRIRETILLGLATVGGRSEDYLRWIFGTIRLAEGIHNLPWEFQCS